MRLPRVAVALGAVALSLSVAVAGPAKPAAAFTVPPIPIAIGGALASAPAAGTVAGGLCATGIGCLALGAIGLGVTLYATQDTWMPWVEGFVNQPRQTPSGGASGCPVTLDNVWIDATGNMSGYVWTDNRNTASGGCYMYDYTGSRSQRLYINNARCIVKTAGNYGGSMRAVGDIVAGKVAVFWAERSAAFTAPSANAGTVYIAGSDVCSTGTQLVGGNVWGQHGSAPTAAPRYGISAAVNVFAEIPNNLWHQDASVQCVRPDGTTFTVTGTEWSHPERVAIPSCRAVDPSSIPGNLSVKDPFGNDTLTYAPPDYETDFPDCFGPSGLLCDIHVEIDGLPCVAGMAGCLHWWANKDSTNPDYDCKFGPYSVPFGNCEPLRRSYVDSNTQTITDPSWPPAPDPEPDPDPEPSPSPSPTGSPSSPPTSGPSSPPTSGPNPNPPPVDPETVDPDSQGCLGENWSWNPVSWVYAPIKCAFIWAFVPSPGFLDGKLEALRDAFNGTMPGAFVTAFTGQTYNLSDTGCGGIPVDWSIEGKSFSFDLLAACSGAMATTASVVKLAASAALVIFGALGCLRGLGAGFGWSPSLGRGGGDSV